MAYSNRMILNRVWHDLRLALAFAKFLLKRRFLRFDLRWHIKRFDWFYEPLVTKLQSERKFDQAQECYEEWIWKTEPALAHLNELECQNLIRKARKIHIQTDDWERETDSWQTSQFGRYLKDDIQLEIKKRIAEAQLALTTAKWDRLTKLGTFVAAVIAAIASVINALHH